MADQLASLLQASLSPQTRRSAEQTLTELSTQSGFLPALLQLTLNTLTDRAIRLAGAVYLKNVVKLQWMEDVNPLPEDDKATLRTQLVPAMVALTMPTDKPIRSQIGQAVSLVAELDFPNQWPDLIPTLLAHISPTDHAATLSVLLTSHSIFSAWRHATASDVLFGEMILVLKSYLKPFMQLFRMTATKLLSAPPTSSSIERAELETLAQAQAVLVDILYDFTCHEWPDLMEDVKGEFLAPGEGWLHRLLLWDPPQLRGEPDDTAPSLLSEIKVQIFEFAEMCLKVNAEILQATGAVAPFVAEVWGLVGDNKLPAVADDQLVSQALRFISTAIRVNSYAQLFSSRETIQGLVQGVVVPNVGLRDHDVEQFEDDPLEFIRLDLALPGISDNATRRQAAADVLQALVASGHEAIATEVVGSWISAGLQQYNQAPSAEGAWRSKDSAVYLLTAVATRGSTTQHGVTSTNALVDVVQFFSDHVFQDLQAAPGSVHPILQVDAIRFLNTFRNQLTKDQLLSVLPLLVGHLGSDNYVTFTYSAITVDRILAISQQKVLMFGSSDIKNIASQMINALLVNIETAESATKAAENDHLMKCVMRVIVTARETIVPSYQGILHRLVSILGVISKNPSNPHFDQWMFESLSALMRFVVGAQPDTIKTFEQTLFGPITIIIQQDIEQYIPYVFQILAQMLELHTHDVPSDYRSLLPLLLNPASWQQKGSIPGLVKLLTAFIARDGAAMIAASQVTPVLGVVQQRLIPSKLNDEFGFILLQAIALYLPFDAIKGFFKSIIMTLLTRMQTSKTDKYAYLFSHFVLYCAAVNNQGLEPDFLIGVFNEIQPGLWPQILTTFVNPQLPKTPAKDRRVAVIGMTKLLTRSAAMLSEPTVQTWPQSFAALVTLFREPQYLKEDSKADPFAGITEIDYEEQTAGYQAAFSKLAASESAPVDPVAYVKDPNEFLGEELSRLAKSDPKVTQLIAAAGPTVAPLMQALQGAGYKL